MSKEIDKIAERYAKRQSIPPWRYSRLNPVVNAMQQERQRNLLRLFHTFGILDLSAYSILEVGCGSGGNLLELIQLGAKPENLVGNELLPERIEQARQILSKKVQLFPGNATQLKFPSASFDIVYQSTVFSSILDDALQKKMASAMWRWVKPGGGILWYDFTFDNPRNKDVRGVPVKHIQQLFPEGRFWIKKVTLAPPIARTVIRAHPLFYNIFNLFPWLRTHVLCYIKKNE